VYACALWLSTCLIRIICADMQKERDDYSWDEYDI